MKIFKKLYIALPGQNQAGNNWPSNTRAVLGDSALVSVAQHHSSSCIVSTIWSREARRGGWN